MNNLFNITGQTLCVWLSNLCATPRRKFPLHFNYQVSKIPSWNGSFLTSFHITRALSYDEIRQAIWIIAVITPDDGTGPAVTQAAGHWFLTAENDDLSPVTSYEIRGWRQWQWQWSRFHSEFLRFRPSNYHSTIAAQQCITVPCGVR